MFVRLLLLPSFLSLDSYPVLFLPFLPSASDALGSIQRRDSGSRSVAAIERFYNESLYVGKRLRLPHCASRNCYPLFTSCQVFLRCERDDRCCLKGVLRLIVARREVTSSQNIFALMKWELCEKRSWGGENLSYLQATLPLISFDKRLSEPWSFFLLFFPDISLFKILFSSSLSFPILRFSISLYRDLGIRFSFLSQFPLVGGHFLLFTSLSAPLLAPFALRFLFAAISVDSGAALGYGILFSCNLLATFQSRKVMCTGYPT